MPKRHAFGFVTEPLTRFDWKAETTLFIMSELCSRGHIILACEPKELFLKQSEPWGRFQKLEVGHKKQFFHRVVGEKTLALRSLSALFLRKDPPFDLPYLHHLYLLMKLEKKVLMINSPTSILEFNEKLVTLDFPFAPKTLVSYNADQILRWGRQFANGIVLKPFNLGGGSGIEWLKKSKIKNKKSKIMVKKMTLREKQPIICQEFLPVTKLGDKRILLWNGKILGQFLRKPKKGDFRANLHAGGHFMPCGLTVHDKKIVSRVGPWTKSKGLYLAGLDVIGKNLTEINITSPMAIHGINWLYDKHMERKIVNDILGWI